MIFFTHVKLGRKKFTVYPYDCAANLPQLFVANLQQTLPKFDVNLIHETL